MMERRVDAVMMGHSFVKHLEYNARRFPIVAFTSVAFTSAQYLMVNVSPNAQYLMVNVSPKSYFGFVKVNCVT